MRNNANKNTIPTNNNTKTANNLQKKAQKKTRIRDWTAYNDSLVRRGDITILVSPAVFLPPKNLKKPGRKQEYSDALIQFLAELREILQLPFRQTVGFVSNLAILQDVNLPSYNRLCVRMQQLHIAKKLDRRHFRSPVCLLVDSTGLKTKGEGEWKVRKHGAGYRRGWKKLHLTVDYRTQLITTHASTPETIVDQAELPTLIDNTTSQHIAVSKVIGDGAYGSHKLYNEIEMKRHLQLLSPPHKNAKLHLRSPKTNPGRGGSGGKFEELIDEKGWETQNRYLRGCLHYGWDGWKDQVGYHKRSLVETAMWRLKSAFSSELKSHSEQNQTIEIAIRIKLLNLWTSQSQNSYKAITT